MHAARGAKFLAPTNRGGAAPLHYSLCYRTHFCQTDTRWPASLAATHQSYDLEEGLPDGKVEAAGLQYPVLLAELQALLPRRPVTVANFHRNLVIHGARIGVRRCLADQDLAGRGGKNHSGGWGMRRAESVRPAAAAGRALAEDSNSWQRSPRAPQALCRRPALHSLQGTPAARRTQRTLDLLLRPCFFRMRTRLRTASPKPPPP
jgi:hypothetical protein